MIWNLWDGAAAGVLVGTARMAWDSWQRGRPARPQPPAEAALLDARHEVAVICALAGVTLDGQLVTWDYLDRLLAPQPEQAPSAAAAWMPYVLPGGVTMEQAERRLLQAFSVPPLLLAPSYSDTAAGSDAPRPRQMRPNPMVRERR